MTTHHGKYHGNKINALAFLENYLHKTKMFYLYKKLGRTNFYNCLMYSAKIKIKYAHLIELSASSSNQEAKFTCP
jgi:hypothetical protein